MSIVNNMKVTYVLCCSIFFCAIYIAEAQYFDWSSFGDIINRQVQAQVRQINDQVNEKVRKINYDVNEQVRNTNENIQREVKNINYNVEAHISDVNAGIHKMQLELATLGPRINEEVQKGLKPLEALKIQSQMARGVGGVTVATYGDQHTIFYKNGIKYNCPGEIIDDDPKQPANCTEKLATNLSVDQKICSDNAYSRVNNIFCFGPNAAITCSYNSCKCLGGTLFTLSGLKNICGHTYGSNIYVKFTYFPIKTDKNHIPLPNSNKHVYCEEADNDFKCTWYGSAFMVDY